MTPRPWIERDDLDAHLDAVAAEPWVRAMAQDLKRDGLATVDLGAAATAACARAAVEVEPLFENGIRRVQDAWRLAPTVRALALQPAVLKALETVYGRKPFAFQTLNFRQGSQQQVHADTMHFHSDPPGFMCGVWIALEDVRPEAGPLVYHPGSHRLPYPDNPEAQALGLDELGYMTRLEQQLQAAALPLREATPRRGQAVIWAANLAHGGGAIADPASTRRSLVVHYFFRGCSYWTPLTSAFDPARKVLRLPTDIATDGWVWPRARNGLPAPVAPRAMLGWARRTLQRQTPSF